MNSLITPFAIASLCCWFAVAACGESAAATSPANLTPIATLRPPKEVERFAAHLDVEGNLLAVGGGSGAFLFTRLDAGGRQWSTNIEKLGSGWGWGAEVDIDADRVIASLGRGGGVWRRQQPGEAAPLRLATLIPADQSSLAQAGEGVALEGDIAVVGAGNNDFQGRQSVGTVSIFQQGLYAPGVFDELKTICPVGIAPGDDFGDNVALEGEVLAASAKQNNAVGAVYLFDRNAGGPDNWGQTAKLVPSIVTSPRSFGSDLAFDGDQLIVGAAGRAGQGQAFIYERDAAGAWQEAARLLPPASYRGDEFGHAVDIQGDLAVVAAPARFHEASVILGARAYVYGRNLGGSNAWDLGAVIDVPLDFEGSEFAYSVAIMDQNILVGSNFIRGAVYVYAIPEPTPLSLGCVAALTVLAWSSTKRRATSAVDK